jgi:membrane protease YdiL (CAAX protease family)
MDPNQSRNTSGRKLPWLYLLIAYGWTWLFWIPVAMTKQDYQKSPLLLGLMFLGLLGPSIAGITLTYWEQGKPGGRDLWRRVFDVRRIRLVWVVVILLLSPLLHLVSMVMNSWLGGAPPGFAFLKETLSMPPGLLVILILYTLQAAFEELGWRGYLIDRLQARWEPLTVSLMIGIFHTFWHLPLFWVVGTNQIRYGFGLDWWMFIAFIVSTSIYSTWCYNANQQSTLAVIFLHTAINVYLDIFLLPGRGEWIYKGLFTLSAIGIALTRMVPWQRLEHQELLTDSR